MIPEHDSCPQIRTLELQSQRYEYATSTTMFQHNPKTNIKIIKQLCLGVSVIVSFQHRQKDFQNYTIIEKNWGLAISFLFFKISTLNFWLWELYSFGGISSRKQPGTAQPRKKMSIAVFQSNFILKNRLKANLDLRHTFSDSYIKLLKC